MSENSRRDINRKKRRNRRILYFFIGIFLIGYGLFWKAYFDVNNTADNIYNSVEINKKRESDVAIKATQPISFAFLGVDNGYLEREGMPGRSDAIMVGTVNPNTKTTTLVSIPRDTYALMDGYETEYGYPFYDKLTHAYAFGEAEMALNSIQEVVNVPIDYYVEVNMQGLIDIVDALGGIEITSPLTFNYQGSQFYKGETRTINGNEALAFSRMRHDDIDGDFGRQNREKMVVKALLDKIVSLDSLKNYQSILDTLEDNVRTNLTFKDMTNMVAAYGKSLENFEQESMTGDELWLDEVYYFYIHPNERLAVSNLLREQLELPEITVDDLHLSETDYYQLEYAEYNSY